MNKRQKNLLRDTSVIMTVTIIAVVGIINFKDHVNRSESMRAMRQLGRIALKYKQQNNSVPPESFIADIRQQLEGIVRLGSLNYRGRWINFDSEPNEILAYAEKKYHSLFFKTGVIVLRLDGTVEWTKPEKFKLELENLQSSLEIEMLKNQPPQITLP